MRLYGRHAIAQSAINESHITFNSCSTVEEPKLKATCMTAWGCCFPVQAWPGSSLSRPGPRTLVGGMLALVVFLWVAQSAAAATADVTTDMEFMAALEDQSINTIRVLDNIGMYRQNWAKYNSSSPLLLSRNTTVLSEPYGKILDVHYNKAVLQLGPGVVFTFQGLVLAKSRYGSGVLVADVLNYSPRSTFVHKDCITIRTACVPNDVALKPIPYIPRLPGYPGKQQAQPVGPGCGSGLCWVSGILYIDLALSPALSDDPNGGGYDIIVVNTTKACRSYASSQCLQEQGADACVAADIEASAADQGYPGNPGGAPDIWLAQSASANRGQRSAQSIIAGAVVGGVVGLLLLMVLPLVVLWRRRRRRRLQQEQEQMMQQQLDTAQQAEHRFVMLDMPPQEEAYAMAERLKQGTMFTTSNSWEIAAQRTSEHMSSAASSSGGSRAAAACASSAVQLGVLLGAGSFGRVYKGVWIGRTVAVKVMRHSSSTAQLVLNEVDLMLSFKHPNVVRALHVINWRHKRRVSEADSPRGGPAPLPPAAPALTEGLSLFDSICSSPDGTGPELYDDAQTWIVQEYCDCGNLGDVFLTGTAVGSPREMLKLLCRLKEVAQAMQYLHSCHVVHGDLKVANVLLASDPAAPYGKVAKVTDFGLSRALQAGQTHRSTRTLGTVSHMSPELLRLGRMSSAADVYAFAIMMWEMVTGKVAFSDMHYGEVVERVGIQSERPPIPPEVPEDYALLMRSCWEELPGARPRFVQITECLNLMLAQVQQEIAASAGAGKVDDRRMSSEGVEDL